MLAIEHDARSLHMPAFIVPGHAKDSITINVGYGRTRAGRVGNGAGFNAYTLRGSASPWFGAATAAKTGEFYDVVHTQEHWSIDDRNIVRSAKLETFQADPAFAKKLEHGKPGARRTSLYADPEFKATRMSTTQRLHGPAVVACVPRTTSSSAASRSRPTAMHWPHRSVFRRSPDTRYLLPADALPAVRNAPAKWCARWPRRRTAMKA